MTRTLIVLAGPLMLATVLGAQPQTPATQPVRTSPRPPQAEPPPLPAPDAGRESPLRPRDKAEDGDVPVSDLTLKGCLARTEGKKYTLTPSANSDAAVTEAVSLQGAVDELTTRVGAFVEVTGRFEQATPATTDAVFAITKVRVLADTCEKPGA